LPNGVSRKCSGVVSSCHADAGEGAQQTIQSIGICVTDFGQETNAAYLVSKCIGDAEACSRAKYTAAGIRHCHLYEPSVRCYIADAAAELNHETPQIQGENIRGSKILNGGFRLDVATTP
jgi:hypothetical protein